MGLRGLHTRQHPRSAHQEHKGCRQNEDCQTSAVKQDSGQQAASWPCTCSILAQLPVSAQDAPCKTTESDFKHKNVCKAMQNSDKIMCVAPQSRANSNIREYASIQISRQIKHADEPRSTLESKYHHTHVNRYDFSTVLDFRLQIQPQECASFRTCRNTQIAQRIVKCKM